MLNIHKRCVFLFLFALFAFVGTSAALTTGTNATPIEVEPSDGIDVILVIDTSGSMRSTDPERITLEAAMLFMDMMETRNSRLGIVGFSGDVHTVIPLMSIEKLEDRNYIRNRVSNFVYHGWTDIGLAMRTATEMLLEDPIETNSPMILLFTDGRIEMGAWHHRSVEESYYDAQWAVDNVGDSPIYTIGLNYDGTVNTEFLQNIARQTNATSHIIEEAALLPRLFNQIFASHIRSSIIEVTEFVAVGATYTEVIIPIPSIFVSEANVIMLSNQPIESVRLHNPIGQEIVFDNEIFTLSTASLHSIVKIFEPMLGDWLLSVRGVPEDRITINLIYNYNVGVFKHVSQADRDSIYFNPTIPLAVRASFVSPLPQSQIQVLLNEATATLNVFDMDSNLINKIPMRTVGNVLAADFVPNPPQNVRIDVTIEHQYLEYRTAAVGIVFDPQLLAELTAPPSPDPEPEPIPPPIAEPPPAAESEPEESLSANIFIPIAITIAAVVLLLMYRKRGKRKIFAGHLEIRALLPSGKYTALEAPDLSTFAGKISLENFMYVTLGSKADKMLETNVSLKKTYIAPVTVAGNQMIRLTTDGAVHITDRDRHAINQRKFIWEKDLQLIFSLVGATSRIEMTYRISEY